jgi:SAM-dependent methyltransferase
MSAYRNKTSISEDVLRRISSKAREAYSEQYAGTYRESDQVGLSDWTHVSWCERLRQISASFGKPIDVLDLGCGTGRYFHCLQNVKSLVGVDISEPMLKIARDNPVLRGEITVDQISLIHGDVNFVSFTPRSFDFVYSVGVLGDYLPPSLSFLERIHSWLKEDGIAFLTVMESKPPERKRWKEGLASFLYPILPHRMKVYIDIRIGDYMMSRDDFEVLLTKSRFKRFEVDRQGQRATFLFATAQK